MLMLPVRHKRSSSAVDMDISWKIFFLGVLLTLKGQALPADYGGDADAGELREDILEINLESQRDLFEGDIAVDPRRNAIVDEKARWKFPIPYILTDSLDLNAKGVILQAFEVYRLKSCVDFKPYEGESTYISFTKLDGCWSFVGDLHTGQNVSIGERCDTKAIVEHELLHALGFYHEQSRSDRDDYVKIWWDQIISGKEHNFNKYTDDFITDLNTPYDYESIMHYRPLSFNKEPDIPTITTAIPAFNEIIGQRLDFSAIDLERLNRMYDCAETHTLLDQCAFEQINICGMIQNENDDDDWVQTLSSTDINDHTLGGQCRDAGYFMKFDTANKEVGHSAILESRILYPKRGYQCLQFFYRIIGGPGDMLVIWLRMDDGTGTVRKPRKVHTIHGDDNSSWKIAHVTLNTEDKFRYFFQGTVTSKKAFGGILIDDIILSETTCPSGVWMVQNFTGLLLSTAHGTSVRSDCFYNSEGYGYGIDVYPNGRINASADYVGVTFHLCSGEDDAVLEWPAINRQATITIMDQDPDATLQMSNSRSFTTDESELWNKPSIFGTWDDTCNCFRGPEFGWSTFISHQQLKRRSFLKNDDLIVTVNFDDLTHLIKSEVPVQNEASYESPAIDKSVPLGPKVREARALSDPCEPNPCSNGGVCINSKGKASCRCPSGQMTVFSGEACEKQHISGEVLGVLFGGAAGTVALAAAIIATIRRQHRSSL
uniref:Meprin A subunit n=1 Tax=Astyanax mexicanus TaxID=7994 RepID=W5KRZ7_ASTMX